MPTEADPLDSAPSESSAALRQRVLTTAAELFARKSFAATTTEEIADSVDELRGTVYYHLKNKQSILEAIQQRLMDELLNRLVAHQEEEGSATDRLARMVTTLTDLSLSHPNEFAASLEGLKYLSGSARKRAEHRSNAVCLVLVDAIEESLAETNNERIDSVVAATAIFYTLATVYRWYRPHGRLKPSKISSEISRLLLGGLVNR
ncbi:TetR/AcrR family transcriptional regulator [Mycolicibacterium sp. XJ1819]